MERFWDTFQAIIMDPNERTYNKIFTIYRQMEISLFERQGYIDVKILKIENLPKNK